MSGTTLIELDLWRWFAGAIVMFLGVVLPIALMASRNRNTLFEGFKRR